MSEHHAPKITTQAIDALNSGLRTVFGAVNALRHFENSPTQIEAEELGLIAGVLDDAFYKISDARDELEAERVSADPELAARISKLNPRLAERIAELRTAKAMTPAEAMAAPADGTTPIMRLRKSEDDLLIAKCELFDVLHQLVNEHPDDCAEHPQWAEYLDLEHDIVAAKADGMAALAAKARAMKHALRPIEGQLDADNWAASIAEDIRRIGRATA